MYAIFFVSKMLMVTVNFRYFDEGLRLTIQSDGFKIDEIWLCLNRFWYVSATKKGY